MNPIVTYGFWVEMVVLCRFNDCNRGTTELGDVDNGRGYVCVCGGGREYMDISVSYF